jgi:anti-sigma regulatory factor (Ser/Thr protein kinase)
MREALERPQLRLEAPASTESVLLVRHVFGGAVELLGLGTFEANDLYTAVAEVCNNVVGHAYPAGGGRMSVELSSTTDALTVLVSDDGVGFSGELAEDEARIGLHLVYAIAERVSLRSALGVGTSIELSFPAARAPSSAGRLSSAGLDDRPKPRPRAKTIACTGELAPLVVPRALAAIAAASAFSTREIRDVEVLGRELARASGPVGVELEVDANARELDVTITALGAEIDIGGAVGGAVDGDAVERLEVRRFAAADDGAGGREGADGGLRLRVTHAGCSG